MSSDELQFMEDCLAANELLFCRRCAQQTLHAHQEVVAVRLVATELRMACTHCSTVRHWLDWNSAQLTRHQRD